MSDFIRESLGQVDDLDCFKGASLDAHTAAYAQGFRNEANDGCWEDLDANLASFVDWTRFLALLFALLGLALVGIDDSNS